MAIRQPPRGFVTDDPPETQFGEAQSWYQLIGPLFAAEDNEPGRVRLGFYSEQRYISSMGRVHGGKLSSFVDYLLFATARSTWEETMLVTVSLNINFVSASPPDVWVTGYGQSVHSGRSMAFVSGEVRANDKIIVQATGTFRRLDKR